MHAQFAVEELVVSDLIFKQAKLQGKCFYSEINLLMFSTRTILFIIMSLRSTNGHNVSNFAKNGRYASINFNLNTDQVK